MKKWSKLILIGFIIFGITGCAWTKEMDNTPTKKVENFLNKYQTLHDDVLKDLDRVVAEETTFNGDQREKYRDIVKSNYQKLTYKIKDENIDGDSATVTAEIEVIDYDRIMQDAEAYRDSNADEFMTDDEFDESKFTDYRLEQLKEAKEKVKYTIDLTLSKVNDTWTLDDLSSENRDKINGMYRR